MAMKTCKECGTEVSSNAKACPKCGNDQRNFFVKHKVLTFFLAIILICVISAASSGDNTNNEGSKNTLTNSNVEQNNNTTSTKDKYAVGEIFEDSTIAIKYVSLNDNFTGYSQYADVKNGYKVIKAEFEFENLSSTDQYVSSYDFNCYADGYDCEVFYYVEDSSFGSTLSAGKKTKGSVYFEVPKDATEIDIEYELNVWTSEKLVFKVK